MSAIVCADCKGELTAHDVLAYIECKPTDGKRRRRVYRHPDCLARRKRGYYDALRRKVLLSPERREKLTRERMVARLWTNSNLNEKKLCLALGQAYTPDTRLSRDAVSALLATHRDVDVDVYGVVGLQVHGLVRKRVDEPLSLENVQVLPLREIRDFIQKASLKRRAAVAAAPLAGDCSSSGDGGPRLEDVSTDD